MPYNVSLPRVIAANRGAAAPSVFNINFETGDTSQADSVVETTGNVFSVVSSPTPPEGTYQGSMVLTTNTTSECYVSKTITPATEFYTRSDFRWTTFTGGGSSSTYDIFRIMDGATSLGHISVQHNVSLGQYKWNVYERTTEIYDGAYGQWVTGPTYDVEIYWKADSGANDGEMSAWINGVEIAAVTNISGTSSNTITSIRCGFDDLSDMDACTGYIDRFMGDTSRIGPFQSGDVVIDETNVTSQALPSWDDSAGTILVDNGSGTIRAIAWDTNGFDVVTNGVVTEQYPPLWTDPPHDNTGQNQYYFAAQDGSDSGGDGSEGSPWRTIAKLETLTLNGGDEVFFKRGNTWTDTWTIQNSGDSDNYIKVEAFGTGADPIIDGGGTRTNCVFMNNRKYLWIKDLDCTNAGSSSSTSCCMFIEGTNRTTVGPMTIENCTFRNSVHTSSSLQGMGLRIDTSTGIRIRNCVAHNNDSTGFWWGWFSDPNRHEDCVFANCEAYLNGGAGAEHNNQVAMNSAWISGQMYGCIVRDSTGTSLMYYDRYARDTHDAQIFNNEFYSENGGYGGINYRNQADGYRNKIYTPDHTFGVVNRSPSSGGDIITVNFHHNVIMASRTAGWECNTPDQKTDEDAGGHWNIYGWNNTINGSGQGSGSDGGIDWGGTDTPVPATESRRAINNLVTNCSGYFFKKEIDFGTEEVDFNYYFNASLSNPFLNGSAKSFSGWQSDGYDANGQVGSDPQYVSASGSYGSRDYNLGSSSPAKSQGTDDVYQVSTNVNSWIGINNAPHAAGPVDVGAYQYNSGKTWDFSKKALGLDCSGNTAGRFALWDTRQTVGTLQTETT